MAHVITSACVGGKNLLCVRVCPVDAIHHEEDLDRMLYIDPSACIDCRGCVPECPVQAIYDDHAVPESERTWTSVNALWYLDRDAARARVDALRPH